MNEKLQPRSGGVRNLVRDLAQRGSMEGTWDEPVAQHSHLERSGSMQTHDFEEVKAVFEARRYYDRMQRLRTQYLARVSASRVVELDELSSHIRAEIMRASVSASVSEAVLRTDSMSMVSDADGDPMEFIDEDGFYYTSTVEYRINGNGEILGCYRSEEYDQDGDVLRHQGYTEPYQRGKLNVQLFREDPVPDLPVFAMTRTKVLKQELSHDLTFFEQAAIYRDDPELIAQSRREHEGRLFAIAAFITMQADSVESLRIALS